MVSRAYGWMLSIHFVVGALSIVALCVYALQPPSVLVTGGQSEFEPPAGDVQTSLPTALLDQVDPVYLELIVGNPTTQPVYTCPSANADKWNFGGGAHTAVNWSNWRGSVSPTRELRFQDQTPSAQP